MPMLRVRTLLNSFATTDLAASIVFESVPQADALSRHWTLTGECFARDNSVLWNLKD